VDAETLAAEHYRRQARIALATSRAAAREWQQMPTADLSAAWATGTGPRLFAIVSAGQLASAEGATEYVDLAATAQGAARNPPSLAVDAQAFSGIAADGRSLGSLLYQPVIHTKTAIAGGATTDRAMQQGLAQLLTIVSSEVPDAGRAAVGTAITADRRCTGYVRVLNPPSCSRCVVLAGKEFAWNQGFQRHPRCDCAHLPTTRYRRGNPAMDPSDYFHSLTRAEQDKTFTVAGARAIRDGADITAVVNARRGISTVGSYVRDDVTHRGRITQTSLLGQRVTTTTESTTKRGLAAQRLRNLDRDKAKGRGARQIRRLTPEAIYQLASDRTEAIRLLHRFGYLY
jgi:hypothetical protein